MFFNKLEHLLDELVKISWEASDAVMEEYTKDTQYKLKQDGSPLTRADLASHKVIVSRLKDLEPEIFIVSEEQSNLERIKWRNLDKFWLIDPLDGTKEFINKNDEFTVNIALIENGKPVLGVVGAPAKNLLYVGGLGVGAYVFDRKGGKSAISVSHLKPDGITVVASRSHCNQEDIDNFLKNQKVTQFISTGSSLKFCKVAEGSAHLYPRLGRTMEWDTAAGHAVLEAAGGVVVQLCGMPLVYGKSGFENPHFVAKCK